MAFQSPLIYVHPLGFGVNYIHRSSLSSFPFPPFCLSLSKSSPIFSHWPIISTNPNKLRLFVCRSQPPYNDKSRWMSFVFSLDPYIHISLSCSFCVRTPSCNCFCLFAWAQWVCIILPPSLGCSALWMFCGTPARGQIKESQLMKNLFESRKSMNLYSVDGPRSSSNKKGKNVTCMF